MVTNRAFSSDKPGPESAILKLVAADAMQALAREALLVRRPKGMVMARDKAVVEGIFAGSLTWSPGIALPADTDEMLRIAIAGRVLDLSAEPRPDRTLRSSEGKDWT